MQAEASRAVWNFKGGTVFLEEGNEVQVEESDMWYTIVKVLKPSKSGKSRILCTPTGESNENPFTFYVNDNVVNVRRDGFEIKNDPRYLLKTADVHMPAKHLPEDEYSHLEDTALTDIARKLEALSAVPTSRSDVKVRHKKKDDNSPIISQASKFADISDDDSESVSHAPDIHEEYTLIDEENDEGREFILEDDAPIDTVDLTDAYRIYDVIHHRKDINRDDNFALRQALMRLKRILKGQQKDDHTNMYNLDIALALLLCVKKN